jgi:hypothetical protein
MLHVSLNLRVCELTTDESLCIEDGVDWVHGDLVLCCIADQTLSIGESNKRGRGTVALVIGNDLDAVISEDAYARVGSSKIDTDRWSHSDESYMKLCVGVCCYVGVVVVIREVSTMCFNMGIEYLQKFVLCVKSYLKENTK